ncbi:Double-strand break repair protein mre11a [Mortierella sp. GBA43]|nr:Double-strand break repair protein mre11a [Mortierella sp. GBA43]
MASNPASELLELDPALHNDGGEGFGDEKDTFSILVATDNHLGYLEKDPVRGDDSFAAFEEILALAADSEVDMILLGGDLFHENKPSRKTMYTTTKLLRKYCLGDKPVSIEFLSDPKDNFPDGITQVNYMDPNLNIGIPVFSIHGNHDDPSGDGNLCALDQLSMSGLVNYFGRSQEIDNVIVKPILLQKGASRLALYGIGNIRDERLHQTFLRQNVKMLRPVEDDGEEPWYNMLVLHQNRVMHGPKSYIPEAFLDDFINLIIWGHEHECLIDPVYNPQQGFHVSQPGSSVATSLSEGESKEKHVAILKICKGRFNIQKIRLQSVRPFIMSDVALADHRLDPNNQEKVNKFISTKVRELVREARQEWITKNARTSRKRRNCHSDGSDDDSTAQDMDKSQELEVPKPLVRLRVDYSGGYEIFNPQRFGQEFVDIVANPRDIIHFHRKKSMASNTGASKDKEDMSVMDATEKLDTMRVEHLVQKYLSAQNLSVLPEVELADAVRIYVEKDEKDAVKDFVVSSLDRMQKAMRTKQNIEVEEALLKEINREKDIQAVKYARDHPNGGLLDHKRSARKGDMDMDMDLDEPRDSDGSDAEITKPTAKASKGRGSKAATKPKTTATKSAKARKATPDIAPARATKAARSSKSRVVDLDSENDDDDDDDYHEPQATGRTSKESQAHVVLDTDDEVEEKDHREAANDIEEDEDDFLTPKRGAKAKAKEVVRSTAKANPKPKAPPAKKATATAATSGTGAASSRSGGSSRSTSQAPSQGASRLVTAIGSRRKKLM